VRWRSDREVACRAVGGHGDAAWCLARLRDLSAGGIRLLLASRFEPGTVLELCFQTAAADLPHDLQARVIHLSPMRYGGWSLGCELTPRLTDRQLHALLLGG